MLKDQIRIKFPHNTIQSSFDPQKREKKNKFKIHKEKPQKENKENKIVCMYEVMVIINEK